MVAVETAPIWTNQSHRNSVVEIVCTVDVNAEQALKFERVEVNKRAT